MHLVQGLPGSGVFPSSAATHSQLGTCGRVQYEVKGYMDAAVCLIFT